MTAANDPPESAGRRARYKWPWFVLAALLLGIALAVLWMSSEVERVRQIRDANSSGPDTNTTPARPRP